MAVLGAVMTALALLLGGCSQPTGNPSREQYTITFATYGGTEVGAITRDAGTQVAQPPEPTRTGYTFQGWFSASSGGAAYTWPYTLTGNITVHAQWADNTYTVTFMANDGSGAAHAVQTVTLPTATVTNFPGNPSRAGHSFNNWNTAANGSGTSFTASTVVSGDITVYAQWTANTYTVTFMANDGAGATHAVQTVTVPAATVMNFPGNPSRAGYSFNNWNTAVNGSGTSFTASTAVSGDITVYAQWTANTYTVTFMANDDSGATHAVQAVTVPTATVTNFPGNPDRAGYSFSNWNTAANGSGTSFTASTTVSGDIAVYAQWTAISYSIAYNNLAGTNNTNPVNYTVESASITLAALAHTSYQFEGWYEDAAFSGSLVASIPRGSTGDKTFYAKWHPSAPIQITLRPVPSDPPLTGAMAPVNQAATFSAGTGYSAYTWYWDGVVISGATSSYTLTANSKPAGIYELSVIVIDNAGERLSARCRVIITAQ
jgi:uncharacterized repeat protein (TIGR02543 family)